MGSDPDSSWFSFAGSDPDFREDPDFRGGPQDWDAGVIYRGARLQHRPSRTGNAYGPDTDAYFIDHAALTFLLNRDGEYIAFFPPGTSAERMVVMVREML